MTSDDRLGEELREAAGRDLPGEEFDRRVMQSIEGGGGERTVALAPAIFRWRLPGLAAAAVLVLLGAWAVATGQFRREGPSDEGGIGVDVAAGIELPSAKNSGPWPRPIRIVVSKDAGLRIDGKAVDIRGLSKALFVATLGTHATRHPMGPSRRNVVILADRRVRWREVQWVMQACADPSVRLWRLHFATAGPDGGKRVLPAHLPIDRGVKLIWVEESPFEGEIIVEGEKRKAPARVKAVPPVEKAVIAVKLRREKGDNRTRIEILGEEMADQNAARKRIELILRYEPSLALELDASAEVPFEDVIRSLDAYRDIGRAAVTFVGAPPPKPR